MTQNYSSNDADILTGSGIRRYSTTCKIVVHSHQLQDPLVITQDAYSISASKTLKNAGKATINLLPGRNYLNFIFPNDYINVYFSLGNGTGWIRTFFGFVDKISESYKVSQDGKPTTQYVLVCSDFQKAFEKTQIYYNANLIGREDLDGSPFAASNVGGLALQTKGVSASGTPGDLVQQIILMLLGFGTQFSLPSSFGEISSKTRLRDKRFELVARLSRTSPDDVRETLKAIKDETEKDIAKLTEESRLDSVLVGDDNSFTNQQTLDRLKNILPNKEAISSFDSSQVHNKQALQEFLNKERIKETYKGLVSNKAGSHDQRIASISATIDEDFSNSLLDIVDIYSFIERSAIDGYITDTLLWEKQGTLMQFLRRASHEHMNELFFDLRPTNESFDFTSTEYSTSPDEIKHNLDREDSKRPNGVRYIPAVVMREYPFSVIDGVDASAVSIDLRTKEGSLDTETLGFIPFGPIFCNQPNVSGRKLIELPKIINPEDLANQVPKRDARPIKHLDTVVLRDSEIIETNFGRTDHELFNLTEFVAQNPIGEDIRYFVNDISPIVTPIQVMRHGLRIRSLYTEFANFSLGAAVRQTIDASKPEKQEEAASTLSPGKVVPPMVVEAGLVPKVTNPNKTRRIGFYPSSDQYNYGWRLRDKGTKYIFHHGLDMQALPGTPVYAIADGEVVGSAPNGILTGYGQCLLLRHPGLGPNGEDLFSFYAHLGVPTYHSSTSNNAGSKVTNGPVEGRLVGANQKSNKRQEDVFSKIIMEDGTFEPIKVTAGQQIGTVGWTRGRNWKGKNAKLRGKNKLQGFFAPDSSHLHFELLHFRINEDGTVRSPSKLYPANSFGPAFQLASDGRPPELEPYSLNRISIDPVHWYDKYHKINLQEAVNGGTAVTADPEEGEELEEESNEGVSDEPSPNSKRVMVESGTIKDETAPGSSVRIQGHVDSKTSRQQLARWALLQDHWYQHNPEYLSGTIRLRGAPEIRVGYRVDLLDRGLSFYVESVDHSWQFPNQMMTTLNVTRGQPNNPFPVHVMPSLSGFTHDQIIRQRQDGNSRLDTFALIPDPLAVRRSTLIRRGLMSPAAVGETADKLPTSNSSTLAGESLFSNGVDAPDNLENYGEVLVPANPWFVFARDEVEYNEEIDGAEDSGGIEPGSGAIESGLGDFTDEGTELV